MKATPISCATLLFVTLLMTCPRHAMAQQKQGPDLTTTLNWMATEIHGLKVTEFWYEPRDNPDMNDPWGNQTTYDRFTHTGCKATVTLTFYEHIHSGKQGVPDTREKDKFSNKINFSRLIPNARVDSVKELKWWSNERWYPNDYPANVYFVVAGIQGAPDKYPLTLVETTDHQLAVRLVNAYNHAILLCGGKAEPF